MVIEEAYSALYTDLVQFSENNNFKIACAEDSFYIYEIVEDAYIDFDKGISIREFPSNCAWLIMHDFKEMKTFDSWLGVCKEIAEIGDYSGILFSLNDTQLRFSPDLTGCVELISQYNPHSWEDVHLYLFPLEKEEEE